MNDSENHHHLLFTPGPLTTSEEVKRAMLVDYGSREPQFVEKVREIRDELLRIAGVSKAAGFEAVPIQGSGTFGIEAAIGSLLPPEGKLLVIVNGAYGRRMVEIAERMAIAVHALECDETRIPDLDAIESRLRRDRSITHLAVVHCETTTGILNPVEAIAEIASRHRKRLLVDAMSSFGGIPIDLSRTGIDILVSSANKCLESVPGFSFVITRGDILREATGWARSVSLDLVAQWEALETDGQFRFTPPTHVILAFHAATAELRGEGGVPQRNRRYRENQEALVRGMNQLGFESLLPPDVRSPIISTFCEPAGFHFAALYQHLAARQLIIYPGKLSQTPSFRIGTIGKIGTDDIELLLNEIENYISGSEDGSQEGTETV